MGEKELPGPEEWGTLPAPTDTLDVQGRGSAAEQQH